MTEARIDSRDLAAASVCDVYIKLDKAVIVNILLPRVPAKGEFLLLIDADGQRNRFCVINVATILQARLDGHMNVGFHVEIART